MQDGVKLSFTPGFTRPPRRPKTPRASRAFPWPLRGVAKSFGGTGEVLKGIDLHIPAGQFVAVAGRSGGGKTTLMRLITGLDRPNSRRGRHPGRVRCTDCSADTGLLFQDARLLPWQTWCSAT